MKEQKPVRVPAALILYQHPDPWRVSKVAEGRGEYVIEDASGMALAYFESAQTANLLLAFARRCIADGVTVTMPAPSAAKPVVTEAGDGAI